jgi:hypothetical protein
MFLEFRAAPIPLHVKNRIKAARYTGIVVVSRHNAQNPLVLQCSALGYPLLQVHGNGLTHPFTDSSQYLGLDGKFMPAITRGHERASEWMTIDCAFDLNQTASSKEFNGFRPDHIGPRPLVRAFLQLCGE